MHGQRGNQKNPPISWDQEQVWEPCLFTFRFQCLGKFFFFWDIGYVTKHRGILRIDLESNGNDETKIYTYLFFWNFHDRSHGESWIQNTILHCLMKMSLKHFQNLFFFLVRETNRAMYNLQVETETRTNQYQFPVYFGPKLQPKKKKKTPSCQFCLGGGISWNGNSVLNVVKLSKPSPRRKDYCQQGQFQPIDLYPFCKSSILGLRETFDLAWHFELHGKSDLIV